MRLKTALQTFGKFLVGRTNNKSIFIYTAITYTIFIVLWAMAIVFYPYKQEDFTILQITISELGRSRGATTPGIFVILNTGLIFFLPGFFPFVFAQFFRYKENLGPTRWLLVFNVLGLVGSLVSLIGILLVGVFHLDGIYGNKVHDGCAYAAFIGVIMWMLTGSIVQLSRGVKGHGYPNLFITIAGVLGILIVIVSFLGIGLSPWYRTNVWDNGRVENPLFIILEWCGIFCFIVWLFFDIISLIIPPFVPKRHQAAKTPVEPHEVSVKVDVGHEESVETGSVEVIPVTTTTGYSGVETNIYNTDTYGKLGESIYGDTYEGEGTPHISTGGIGATETVDPPSA